MLKYGMGRLLCVILLTCNVYCNSLLFVFEQLQKDEKDINLVETLLHVDKLIYPDILVDNYLYKLQKQKNDIFFSAYDNDRPLQLKDVAEYIVKNNYAYDVENADKILTGEVIEPGFISYYLDNKKGTCLTMSIHFWMLSHVFFPEMKIMKYSDHMFVMGKHPELYYEITTDVISTLSNIRSKYDKEYTFRPYTKKEIIFSYLNQYGLWLYNNKDYHRALYVFKYINKKIKRPHILNNIATCYYRLWEKTQIQEYYILARKYKDRKNA